MPQTVQHSLVKALRSIPDFASLDDRTLLSIVGASSNLVWRAESEIFAKGTPSDALYIVLSGSVRIFDETDGKEVEFSTVRPGESFGELSLMLNTTHTKGARAQDDSELMVVPKESFEELLASNDDLAAQFRERVEQRQAVEAQGVPTT